MKTIVRRMKKEMRQGNVNSQEATSEYAESWKKRKINKLDRKRTTYLLKIH